VSEAAMTVGQTVARARADAGMTVAQVADTTRIRATLVTAIENDDFRLCGGDVYARGHLKSIATAVGLDPAGLLALFDAQEGASRAAVQSVAPIDQPTHVMEAGGSRGLGALAGTLGASVSRSRGTNWSAVMALALVVIVGAGMVSFLTNRPSGSTPVAGTPLPSSSGSASASATPLPTPTDQATPDTSPSDDVVAQADGVRVVLTVTGRASWMRVTGGANGRKTLYEGTLTRGETQTFTDKAKVSLLIGNAGAVELTVNGRDLGAPGEAGQVVKTSFEPGDPTGQTG
jgi:cytoskeletal protein RodZ